MRKYMLITSSFVLEYFQTWMKDMATFPSVDFKSRTLRAVLISLYELQHTWYDLRSDLNIDLIVTSWLVLGLTTMKWKYSSVEINMWGSLDLFFILLLLMFWQKYEHYNVESWPNRRVNRRHYRDFIEIIHIHSLTNLWQDKTNFTFWL